MFYPHSIFIIGAGAMARAIAYDFRNIEPKYPLIVLDNDRTTLTRLTDFIGAEDVQTIQGDAGDLDLLKRLMSGAAASIGAASYRYHYEAARTAVHTGSHWLDLGGNPDVVARQFALHADAVKAGVGVIPDCGLAPGMINILAGELARRLDEVKELHLRVGGLPQNPQPSLFYGLVFSPEGLANEYYEPARIIEDGLVRQVESLTGWERVYFGAPFGTLEAFHTSGGSSTLIDTFKGKIQTLDYKTLRYAGHLRRIKLLKDLGLFSPESMNFHKIPSSPSVSPRQVLGCLLEETIGWCKEDLVAVKAWAYGRRNNRMLRVECSLVDYYDAKTNLTAMARTTGFPAAIIARMLADKRVLDAGVLKQEVSIDSQAFMSELRARGIVIDFRELSVL